MHIGFVLVEKTLNVNSTDFSLIHSVANDLWKMRTVEESMMYGNIAGLLIFFCLVVTIVGYSSYNLSNENPGNQQCSCDILQY